MRITSKTIAVAVIVAAAIWFILVNTQKVSIYLWVPKVTGPLWVVLLLTFVGGIITGLLLRWRRRDRRSTR